MTTSTLPAHGEYSRYRIHGCRCDKCLEGSRSYRLRLAYDRVNGVHRRVDSTQTRAHIERLIARGWTQEQIAAAAGLNQATVSIVLSRRFSGCRRATATAILGIQLDQAPPIPRGYTDVTGTRRRLQALMVLGYSLPEIARSIGVSASSLREASHGHSLALRTGTAEKVARIYRKLSVCPAPPTPSAELVRNEAAKRGWHGPMAWEDIDDPACKPEADVPSAPQHVHAEDVAELAARGLSDEQIGLRLRVSARTVLRCRIAHNIPSPRALT